MFSLLKMSQSSTNESCKKWNDAKRKGEQKGWKNLINREATKAELKLF